MLTTAFVGSILVGFLRGGSLRPFADLELRALWLVLVAFGGQVAMRVWHLGGAAVGILYGVTFALLLLFIWLNRRHWELAFMGTGIIANALVIWANGGRMPVSLSAYARATGEVLTTGIPDPTHVTLGAGSRFPWLADVWVLPRPYPLAGVFSLGDVLVAVGLFLFMQRVMLGKSRLQGN